MFYAPSEVYDAITQIIKNEICRVHKGGLGISREIKRDGGLYIEITIPNGKKYENSTDIISALLFALGGNAYETKEGYFLFTSMRYGLRTATNVEVNMGNEMFLIPLTIRVRKGSIRDAEETYYVE